MPQILFNRFNKASSVGILWEISLAFHHFWKDHHPPIQNSSKSIQEKGHQKRARAHWYHQPSHFFRLTNDKNTFVFRVYRGLYYPVMWGLFHKPSTRIPIKQPVYHGIRIRDPVFFFFEAKLGLNSSRFRVQVTDFGLSKIMRPKLLDPNLFLGPGSDQRLDPPMEGFPAWSRNWTNSPKTLNEKGDSLKEIPRKTP